MDRPQLSENIFCRFRLERKPESPRVLTHEEIQAQIDEFLQSGGEIEKVDSKVMQREQPTVKQRRAGERWREGQREGYARRHS